MRNVAEVRTGFPAGRVRLQTFIGKIPIRISSGASHRVDRVDPVASVIHRIHIVDGVVKVVAAANVVVVVVVPGVEDV